MKSGDPLILLAAVVIGAIVIAFPLAILIDRIRRWWRFEKIIKHIEPNIVPVDGFKLHEREILPPHKSAARPSNVTTIARKPVHKSTPKSAA